MGPSMKHFMVRPRSRRGWLLMIVFLSLVVAGVWPVVSLFNRTSLWWGLPSIVVWTYAIVAGCWVTMLIANRWLGGQDHDV